MRRLFRYAPIAAFPIPEASKPLSVFVYAACNPTLLVKDIDRKGLASQAKARAEKHDISTPTVAEYSRAEMVSPIIRPSASDPPGLSKITDTYGNGPVSLTNFSPSPLLIGPLTVTNANPSRARDRSLTMMSAARLFPAKAKKNCKVPQGFD